MIYNPVGEKSLLWIYEVNRAYHNKHHVRMMKIIEKQGISLPPCWKKGDYLLSPTGLAYQIVYISKSAKTIKIQPLNNDGTPFSDVVRLDKDVPFVRFSPHQFRQLLKIQVLLDYHRHCATAIHTAQSARYDRSSFSVATR